MELAVSVIERTHEISVCARLEGGKKNMELEHFRYVTPTCTRYKTLKVLEICADHENITLIRLHRYDRYERRRVSLLRRE